MTNLIDWPALLKLTNNRLELAKELLNMFAAELPLLRSAINTAHDKNDWKEMKAKSINCMDPVVTRASPI